jgi:hypothetical protein
VYGVRNQQASTPWKTWKHACGWTGITKSCGKKEHVGTKKKRKGGLKIVGANPYKQAHKDAERDFSWDVPESVTDALVEMEYSSIRDNEDGIKHDGCPGNGTFWYKATVGVWKCTGCGKLARCYGGEVRYV